MFQEEVCNLVPCVLLIRRLYFSLCMISIVLNKQASTLQKISLEELLSYEIVSEAKIKVYYLILSHLAL